MIRTMRLWLFAGFMFAAWAQPAEAQLGITGSQEAAPAAALPPMPQAAQPVVPNPNDKPANTTTYDPTTVANNARAQGFPVLPTARACRRDDLLGLWKLSQLFEVPPSIEMNNYSMNPVQYMLFNSDDTFGKLNSGQTTLEVEGVRNQITQQTSGLQQFVIQDSGMVYFYQNSVAVDSQACFIVANHSGTFLPGQMMLMPPAGQTSVRVVKVYEKIWSTPGSPNSGKRNPRRGRPRFRR